MIDAPQKQFFVHDGLQLAYATHGSHTGIPILLIHGFASNIGANWVFPGWFELLANAGYHVIAIDNRGHGDSDKPHGTQFYDTMLMARDSLALLDHLGIDRAFVMGYSMGARITAHIALQAPDRVCAALLGGLGSALMSGLIDADDIVAALLAPSLDDVPQGGRGYMFRAFAEQTGADLQALADCMAQGRAPVSAAQLASWSVPCLISVGTRDSISGSADELSFYISGSEVLHIPNREHMPAVGDKVHKAGVLDFLIRHTV